MFNQKLYFMDPILMLVQISYLMILECLKQQNMGLEYILQIVWIIQDIVKMKIKYIKYHMLEIVILLFKQKYYDPPKEKHVYDDQYLVRYEDWLEDNGLTDNQQNYEMFRKECELEGKTVEKNGIHSGIVNTKTAILNENESKTESIVFNEYVVYDENQYLPMSAVTVERSKYLIIWRDPNFIKGGYEENENYSEKFHNNLNVNKKFISAHSGCNVYCEPTEGALELIRRKKSNKIILISNIGDDLGGKSFVEEAHKILGSNVIVFFSNSNEEHLNWIKDYPNALYQINKNFLKGSKVISMKLD